MGGEENAMNFLKKNKNIRVGFHSTSTFGNLQNVLGRETSTRGGKSERCLDVEYLTELARRHYKQGIPPHQMPVRRLLIVVCLSQPSTWSLFLVVNGFSPSQMPYTTCGTGTTYASCGGRATPCGCFTLMAPWQKRIGVLLADIFMIDLGRVMSIPGVHEPVFSLPARYQNQFQLLRFA